MWDLHCASFSEIFLYISYAAVPTVTPPDNYSISWLMWLQLQGCSQCSLDLEQSYFLPCHACTAGSRMALQTQRLSLSGTLAKMPLIPSLSHLPTKKRGHDTSYLQVSSSIQTLHPVGLDMFTLPLSLGSSYQMKWRWDAFQEEPGELSPRALGVLLQGPSSWAQDF